MVYVCILQFVGPDTKQDDPLLITAIRQYVIDTPRPFVFKLSYPMIETPQAKAAKKILKNKVIIFCIYIFCSIISHLGP